MGWNRGTGRHRCFAKRANLCKLIAIAGAIATTVLATAVSSLELLCSHPDDFFYTVPGTRCSSYYRCYDNQAIRFGCADGAKFDFQQQRCIRTEGTCYEPVCTGKTNGAYADASQACKRSYQCQGGSLIAMDNCPAGLVFDGTRCSPQREVVCENPAMSSSALHYETDSRCYGLSDGQHVVQDGTDCRRYLVCSDGEVQDVLECPPGYGFDERTRRCTMHSGGAARDRCNPSGADQSLQTLDNSCSFLPDGLHLAVTSRDCRTYVRCLARRQISRSDCPQMTVFNGQQCVPSFLYHCPRLDPPGDICQYRHDGYYVDPRRGCGFYVRCQGERTVEQYSCPRGLYFDETSNECRENEDSNGTCHRTPYSVDCAHRAAGYYQDFTVTPSVPIACGAYFHCHNGAKTSLRCADRYVFDGENCVPEATYQCPVADADSCRGKPNGYHKDTKAGCRAYHLCTDGHKISYLCGPGQIYADGGCTVRGQGQDAECDDDSVCAGRPDAFYADRGSQCREYYYCQRGEKLQTLTCRGSKVFDGRSCVAQGKFSCPPLDDVDAAASENCITRNCHEPMCARGGFFADYDTGCERYFFCIDGKQSTLACSADYVFNGEICVPRGSYYCPRYCIPPDAC
ncbi:uncharacterized protein LOC131208206 [Anopheles bellator]|uniref:uncharacterized protein LOC131208206 n=1 Tax=Anopheles bellator TaxID=139047 RepID=UPI002649E241|nr:uncharacterized protein LOC131208206 [Anopheles bellator]